MPRKEPKKKSKRSRQHKRASINKNGPTFIRHPFSKIERETLIKTFVDLGETSNEKFSADLAALNKILSKADPLQSIATLSTYGLFVGMSKSGAVSPLLKVEHFNQAHVELVQAIALQIPETLVCRSPPHPALIGELFELLPRLGNSFGFQRMSTMQKERLPKESAVLVLQEHLRLNTQSVRNWSYFDRVLHIVRQIIAPIDIDFQQHIGITATSLIECFHFLVKRGEALIEERWKKLRKVFSEPTLERAVATYHEMFPHLSDSPEGTTEMFKRKGLPLNEAKQLLLLHSELSLAQTFDFTNDEICNVLGSDRDAMDNVLDKLALSFGDLASYNTEFLFLNNPVWTHPLIKISKGKYFCATPQVFFSFIFPIFNQLVKDNEALKTSYHKRRAEFLESEVANLFTRHFPQSTITSHYKWKDNGDEYETDLMVMVDSHLFIIEAKSGGISWPALRGAPDRARRHIEELLYDPSQQSLRLEKKIRTAINEGTLHTPLLPNLPFNIEQVSTFLRISVTLEDFTPMRSSLPLIKQAGWIPEEHPLAIGMSLADLEIVFDVLEPVAQKIHYIRRRSDLQNNMNYLGDELDMLGLYLETGFNIGEAEFSGEYFCLTPMSSDIDRYFTALAEGIQTKKPRLRLTQWWQDICNRVEERQFYQWTDVSHILLEYSFAEQLQATQKFQKIKKRVRKEWLNKNHICSATLIPNKHRSDALSLYAFRERRAGDRKGRMENIASQAFASPHVKRCLVIGVNIDRDEDYPYATIMVFLR